MNAICVKLETYQEELEEGYKQKLKESGFGLAQIAEIILMPWVGIPNILFGKKVPKSEFDEAEYQKRLKEVNADDATIKAWLEGTGITFKDEKLIGPKEGFGIPE